MNSMLLLIFITLYISIGIPVFLHKIIDKNRGVRAIVDAILWPIDFAKILFEELFIKLNDLF